MVVASVYRRSTGGHSIEVSRVSHNSEDIQVNIRERLPEGNTIMMVTWPYVIARVSVPANLQGKPVNFTRSQVQGENGTEMFLRDFIYGEDQTLAGLAMEDRSRRNTEGAPVRLLTGFEAEVITKDHVCPQKETHALATDVSGGINPITVYFCEEHGLYYTAQTTGEGEVMEGPYQPGKNELPENFQQLAQGGRSGYTVSGNQYFVLTDRDSFSFMYGWATGSFDSTPEVDFENGEAVAMAASWKGTGGYSLEVTDVCYGAGFTQINIREIQPNTGDAVTLATTYPYVIARFQVEGEVRFTRSELKDGVENHLKSLHGADQKTLSTLVEEELQGRLTFAESIAASMDEDLVEGMWDEFYPASTTLPIGSEGLVVTSVGDLFGTGGDHPHVPSLGIYSPADGFFWVQDQDGSLHGPLYPGGPY